MKIDLANEDFLRALEEEDILFAMRPSDDAENAAVAFTYADLKTAILQEAAQNGDAAYLPIDGKAIDATKLGGKLAGDYAAAGHGHDGVYLPIDGKAVDAAKLDGKPAGDYAAAVHGHDGVYLPIDGKAADAAKLNGKSASNYAPVVHEHDYLPISGKAADAAKLNGKPASNYALAAHEHDYLPISGKAADAAKLDGKRASDFAAANHSHPPPQPAAHGHYKGWKKSSAPFSVAEVSGWQPGDLCVWHWPNVHVKLGVYLGGTYRDKYQSGTQRKFVPDGGTDKLGNKTGTWQNVPTYKTVTRPNIRYVNAHFSEFNKK